MSIFHLILILLIYFYVIRPIIRVISADLYPHLKENDYKSAIALRAVYVVAKEVAHADGKEDEEELAMVIQMVRKLLGKPNLDAKFIIDQYYQQSNTPLTHDEISKLSIRYRQIVFMCAINVAISDHKVTSKEIAKLRNIGKRLEIPQSVVEQLLNQLGLGSSQHRDFQGESINAREFAYKVLELEDGASQKEIKKAYRRLAMKNHPDRVPKEMKKEATERFKEIGDAYKILKESG